MRQGLHVGLGRTRGEPQRHPHADLYVSMHRVPALFVGSCWRLAQQIASRMWRAGTSMSEVPWSVPCSSAIVSAVRFLTD
jgi:hypothetical protein